MQGVYIYIPETNHISSSVVTICGTSHNFQFRTFCTLTLVLPEMHVYSAQYGCFL